MISSASNRVILFSFAALTFGVPVTIYLLSLRLMGFPDGYVTELERARRLYFYVYSGLSFVMGGWFVYRGWKAARQASSKATTLSILIYGALTAAVFLLDLYARHRLDGGAGG